MLKTIGCGELRAEHAGEPVTLAGWVHRRRDHGGLIFLDLRDSTGIVQVVVHPEHAPVAAETVREVRAEWVLQVAGLVERRREGTENAEMATGEVEVQAQEVVVLNPAETPPFPINQEAEAAEVTRLKYRYLDLRRERMTRNLRLRHRVTQFMRRFLDERGFIEVETPVLGAATPEGARDYLVPSRVHPGSFYALPQSPQQYKQLLMVAGVDRYFQIARCYRDEDLRADRQPEFTQLDLEMAFAEQDDVLGLTEELYTAMVRELVPHYRIESPFPRLTYADAMERYGSDKPDLRYGMEIHDLSAEAAQGEFRVFQAALEAGGRVRGLAVPGGADTPRREIDRMTEMAQELGAKGLVWVAFEPAERVEPAGQSESAPLDGLTMDDVRSPVARFFSPEALAAMGGICGARRGDLLLIVADEDRISSRVLDALRRHIAAERELADPNLLKFCFVTDAPMFEWDEAEERWGAVHHLFTMPREEDWERIESDPGAVGSYAYDLVCNGYELASGSIRTHRREILERVLRVLGMSMDEAYAQFGHMLEAFTFGAPPHGGIAPGLDRTVALLAGERDIREVIAFPKTKSASDPMTGAPSPVTARALREVHIELDAEARAAVQELAAAGERPRATA